MSILLLDISFFNLKNPDTLLFKVSGFLVLHVYKLYMFYNISLIQSYKLFKSNITSKEHNNLSCTNIDSLL